MLSSGVRRHACMLMLSILAMPAGLSAYGQITMNGPDLGSQSNPKLATPYGLLPEGKELLLRPEKGQVYQVDDQPIGSRRPLLMVHGGNGETKPYFRWDKVIKRFTKDSAFNRNYKIYLYRYDSEQSLRTSIPQFREAIVELSRGLGNQPVTIMALSLGGNLAQGALLDTAVDRVVGRVLTLGTPFHGSPLFCADWYRYSLDKGHLLPTSRRLFNLDYRLYFNRHQNYLHDLKWDNADSLIPHVGRFKARFPGGPKGNLTVKRDGNPLLSKINQESSSDKSKFVTYAGYLLNPYIVSGSHKRLESLLLAPYTFLTVKIPAQLGRERPALKLLNRQISSIDIDPGLSLPDPHVYDLNDGITPVSSALFLPDEVIRRYPILTEDDLNYVRYATDVGLARVFRDIDHVTYVDGNPPHHGSTSLRDELHPLLARRSILDWMLFDLIDSQKARPGCQLTTSEPAIP